jgi:hypothetical protein
MTLTDDPLLEMPAYLERELDAIGVRRAFYLRQQKAILDWSFKQPVFDDKGNPEF